jgi:hypothetical protein
MQVWEPGAPITRSIGGGFLRLAAKEMPTRWAVHGNGGPCPPYFPNNHHDLPHRTTSGMSGRPPRATSTLPPRPSRAMGSSRPASAS